MRYHHQRHDAKRPTIRDMKTKRRAGIQARFPSLRSCKASSFLRIALIFLLAANLICILLLYNWLHPIAGTAADAPNVRSSHGASSNQHGQNVNDNHEDATASWRSAPKFLWGIPTIADEVEQRQLLRETYLSVFQKGHPASTSDDEHRICALHQILRREISLEDCQVTYVFFLGGNATGPNELVGATQTIESMTLPTSASAASHINEPDVLHLNVHENLEDGKMQTWFKYGSLIAQQHEFDFIAKVDSDTLVFVPTFLDYMQKKFKDSLDSQAPFPRIQQTYVGLAYDKNYCDPTEKDVHPCPLPLVGELYMSGELYFMTPDLADFITSDACDRAAVTIPHEDVAIGNFVFLSPHPVHTVSMQLSQVLRGVLRKPFLVRGQTAEFQRCKLDNPSLLWGHSIAMSGGYFKDPANFRNVWHHYVGDATGMSWSERLNYVLGI